MPWTLWFIHCRNSRCCYVPLTCLFNWQLTWLNPKSKFWLSSGTLIVKSLFVSFPLFGNWDLPYVSIVWRAAGNLDKLHIQNLAVCFFAFFSFLDFLPHFSISVMTITSLHWVFKPPNYMFSNWVLLTCCGTNWGLLLDKKPFKNGSRINTHSCFWVLLVVIVCFQGIVSRVYSYYVIIFIWYELFLDYQQWVLSLAIVLMCMTVSRYILLWFPCRTHFEEKF